MRLMSWVNAIKVGLESEGATVFFQHTSLVQDQMAVQISYDFGDNSYDHIFLVSENGVKDIGRTLR